jgi:hypothetical protein
MPFRRVKTAALAFAAICCAAPVALGADSVADDASPPVANADARRQEMARRIDALLAERWKAEDIQPAPPASDGEFLRRAYLDFVGVIPRASEVRDFLADDRSDKQNELVERLLKSPRYATHMATTWRNRIIPQEVDPARTPQALGLQKWLRTRFAKNLRYDNLVGGLLLATSEDEFGPALYFQANDLAPEKMAGSAAELFLGVDMHCAQCHDHPFAEWSQRDFWGMAAFFARIKAPNNRGMMQMAYRLEDADSGEVKLPESDEVVSPKYPRGDAATDDQWQTRRQQLVVWMTSRDNRFFSRAAVNWAWSHMFGRGLVASLNEMDQPEAEGDGHKQLLDELADYFVESDFNLAELWRTLASTRAYQLSSQHPEPKMARPELFARMLAKPLTPEQLYDSFAILAPALAVTTVSMGPPGSGMGLDEDPARAEFVRRMRPPQGDPTEYRAGTLQALLLMNGGLTAKITGPDSSSLLGALDAPFMSDDDRVESLFFATLARRPDADEQSTCGDALRACKTPKERHQALSDILWALVNSTEFAFNH